ncbi:MAG TPA: sigma-70 family RNA polymerase sigma factor [Euzebyales bacterium]|nr:sigma-70 family RNA polymerase sigma factor [Euzebyales bacterium]
MSDKTLSSDTTNALVTEHLYLVQQVVNQLASRYPRHVDRSELWSAGAYGLVDASRRFDPDAGIPFPRYAAIRIRGAIIDSTRTRDWATRRLRRDIRTVREARDGFEVREGRAPNEHELAGLLKIDIAELREHRAAAANATLLHLDHPLPGTDSTETGLAARLEERERERLPEDAIEHNELVGTVRSAVSFLPEPQREVVERYYFRGELLRDIADSLGVTEARASQIRSEALDAMRAYFGSAFEGVMPVAPKAPGIRRRAAYVEELTSQSTWRTRIDAAPPPNDVDLDVDAGVG